MYENSLGSVTAEVESLLTKKLNAKGRDLAAKLQDVGRALPARVRAQAQYLAEAEARCRNPKRANEYSAKRVAKARDSCVDHLNRVNPNDRKAWQRSAWLIGMIINGLLFVAIFGVVLAYFKVI